MKSSKCIFLVFILCAIFVIRISAQDTIPETQKKEAPVIINDKEKNEKEVFLVVEDPPEFPGGEQARTKFLSQNIIYPREARENGIQGTVYVSFIVETDGSITNVKIIRGIGGGCDEEVVRVVTMMPNWKPGIQRGKPVRVQFNMPVKFTINSEDKTDKPAKPQKTPDKKEKDKLLF